MRSRHATPDVKTEKPGAIAKGNVKLALNAAGANTKL